MDVLLGQLPQLVALIEKAGVVGLLVIFCAVLIWEIRKGRQRLHDLREEMTKIYGQRDKWRLAYVKCKAACDGANPPIRVDLSDLGELVGEAK